MTTTPRLSTPPSAVTFINPPGLYDPRPNGYSHVAVVSPGARLVWVSGQGGEDASGALTADFAAQVRQSLDNLRVALHAVQAQPRDVAKLTVLVVEHSEARLRVFSQALGQMWGDAAPPACTLIPVTRLALDGMLVEIEAIAVL